MKLLSLFLSIFLIYNFALADKAAPVLKLGEPLPANLFVELGRIANPAVVNISTKIKPMLQPFRDPFFDMLEQFYGFQGQIPPQFGPGRGKNRGGTLGPARPHSLGTGFIIREDGLIVTNNHVIAGADEIDVQIDEKSEKSYRAVKIGSDDRTDIALIKIEGKNFPTLTLGSSADSQVGEWVAAFGNPYGQGHSMTKGIISAKGRDLTEINRFPMIQTDAPINPGNSGGPLVNSKGQVIGVNAAIDPRAQGIGFAIPIDEVKALLPQLEKTGHIKRGFLGVQLADLNPQAAAELGLDKPEGSLIISVERNSPAHKAGIRPYDVITDVNGKKIKHSMDLTNTVADAEIGSTLPFKIIREGKAKTLDVAISERLEVSTRSKSVPKKFYGDRAPHDLGMTIVDANAEVRKEFDLEPDVNKPIIVDIENNSHAARAGFLPGDIILDVNRKEVSTAAEAMKLFKKGTNTVRLVRQQATILVMFEVK